MFQASKMREVAEKVQEDNDTKEAKALMNKVITQSNDGQTTLIYKGTLSQTNYKLFKRLGYNIEEESENSFTLNW
tara:strand:- start:524 stop:748 length:225 start_codon:yes stop_codon:yes gene_type:complete